MLKINRINKILVEVEYSLEIFEKQLSYQDKFLKSEVENLKNKLNTDLEKIDCENQDSIINTYHEMYLDFLSGTYPDIQNKMSLVMIYSVFEKEITKLADELSDIFNTLIKQSELRGDFLESFKKFLTKFCAIDEQLFKQDSWEKILCIRFIRNKIVHETSYISKGLKDKSLKKHILEFEKISGVVIIDEHFCMKNGEFPRYFLKIIRDFFKNLVIEFKKNQVIGLN